MTGNIWWITPRDKPKQIWPTNERAVIYSWQKNFMSSVRVPSRLVPLIENFKLPRYSLSLRH